MKGHNGGNNNTIKGKQLYVIMLILAFGAAIMGLMLMHKIRERRIYTILVKEKDHQLISLHLLLQKERDHIKDAKRKIQEMKAKILSLRTQKMELERKFSEMQSIISSLKEEQRILETSLEEKHNEIKFLRAKETEPNTKNQQSDTLPDALKQKESETEHLEHRLENPTRIWSVSTDNPSDLTFNSTNSFQNQVSRDEIENEQNGDEIEGMQNEGLTLEEVRGNFNSSETDIKTANKEAIDTKGEIENLLSLHGDDEGQQMERESGYTSDAKEKRLRLRARQQRRGAHVIRHRRFHMNEQHNGKYRRIVEKQLEKLGMRQGVIETRINKKLKHKLGQDNEMGKSEKIDLNEHPERKIESNFTNDSVEKMQRNDTIDNMRNLSAAHKNYSEARENDVSERSTAKNDKVQLETNDGEGVDLSAEGEKIGRKSEEVEIEGDYRESNAMQEERKEGKGEETDELDF